MTTLLDKLNPVVPRGVLPVIAGVIWALVGLMLCTRAGLWLSAFEPVKAAGTAAVGIVLGVIMIRTSFLPLVAKNLARIARRPERTCLFSMFPWRSWTIALVMSIAGGLLRRSGAPRLPLAGMYLAMGLCLLAGAVLYFRSAAGGRPS